VHAPRQPSWLHNYALVCAGIALAAGSLYLGLAVRDGLDDHDLWRYGRWLKRWAMYAPVAALPATLMLGLFHRALRQDNRNTLCVFIAIPRAFVHFALYGLVMLLQIILFIFWAVLLAIARLLRIVEGDSATARDGIGSIFAGTALWFITYPFSRTSPENMTPPPVPEKEVLPQLAYLLPWLIAGVVLWAGASDEETGNRVDPRWMTLAASYWFADYFFAWAHVRAALRSTGVERLGGR
jgi:hypothetical protein